MVENIGVIYDEDIESPSDGYMEKSEEVELQEHGEVPCHCCSRTAAHCVATNIMALPSPRGGGPRMRRSMEKLRALMIQGDKENRQTMLNTALNSKSLGRPKLKPCIKTITSELKPTRSVSFIDTPKMRPFLSTFSSMIGLATEPPPRPLAEIRVYERPEDKILDDVTPLWEQRAVNGGQVLEEEEIDCTYLMYGRLVTGTGSEGFPTQNGELGVDDVTDDDEYSSGTDLGEEEGDDEESASASQSNTSALSSFADSSHSFSGTLDHSSTGPRHEGGDENAFPTTGVVAVPLSSSENWLSDVLHQVTAQRKNRKRTAVRRDDEDVRDEHVLGASAHIGEGLGTLEVAPEVVSRSQEEVVPEAFFGLDQTIVPLNDKGYPMREGVEACEEYVTTGQCRFEKKCQWHHPNSPCSDEASGSEGRGGDKCSASDRPHENTNEVPIITEAYENVKRRGSNDSSSTADRCVDEAGDDDGGGSHSDGSRSRSSCHQPRRKMLRTH